jgi:glycerol-3-phosphate acyltransferase PlsY
MGMADMFEHPNLFTALAVAYVIGATPFGFLAGKWRGIDIREHGSGNIGATNVIRVLGKKIGIPIFILDFLKGLLPVLLFLKLGGGDTNLAIAAALGAVLGHNYTFWLGYKGGKGVATSGGALLGLVPIPALIVVGTWIVFFYATRFVAVASIAAAVVLPVATWWQQQAFTPVVYFTIALAALAIWRHRSNIQRLRAGTENRFTRKSKCPAPPATAIEEEQP